VCLKNLLIVEIGFSFFLSPFFICLFNLFVFLFLLCFVVTRWDNFMLICICTNICVCAFMLKGYLYRPLCDAFKEDEPFFTNSTLTNKLDCGFHYVQFCEKQLGVRLTIGVLRKIVETILQKRIEKYYQDLCFTNTRLALNTM